MAEMMSTHITSMVNEQLSVCDLDKAFSNILQALIKV